MTVQVIGNLSGYRQLSSSLTGQPMTASVVPNNAPGYTPPQAPYPAYQPQAPGPVYQQQPAFPGYQPQVATPFFQPQAPAPVYQPQPVIPGYQPQVAAPVYQPQAPYPINPQPAASPAYGVQSQPNMGQSLGDMVQQITLQFKQLQQQVDALVHGRQAQANGPVMAPPPALPPAPPAPPPPPPPAPPVPPAIQQAPVPGASVQQVAPAAPVQKPAPAQSTGFNLPGIRRGMAFAVNDGTVIRGYSVGGDGIVNRADAKQIDLTVNASAMMGIVSMSVNVHCEMLADGRVRLSGSKASGGSLFDETMTVVSNKPGQMVLKDNKGNRSSITADNAGNITIQRGEDILRLHRA